MKGIGILVNILSVLVGGGFGVMFRGKLKVSYQRLIYHLLGFAVLGVGTYEFIFHYFVFDGGEAELAGSIFVILSLLLGGLMGHLFYVAGGISKLGVNLSAKDTAFREKEKARLDRLSAAVEAAVERGVSPPKVPLLDRWNTYDMPAPLSDNLYADGFLLAVVFLCANSFLFNGTLNDGLSGESELLLIKSLMDFIFCFFVGLFCGSGPLYAVIPMGALEAVLFGMCIVFPNFTAEFFTPSLSAKISVIGAVIMIFLGIQMAFDRKKPRAADLLPAFLLPILYSGILFVVNLFIGE